MLYRIIARIAKFKATSLGTLEVATAQIPYKMSLRVHATDYGHTKAKSLILCGPCQIQIPIPNKYLGFGINGKHGQGDSQ